MDYFDEEYIKNDKRCCHAADAVVVGEKDTYHDYEIGTHVVTRLYDKKDDTFYVERQDGGVRNFWIKAEHIKFIGDPSLPKNLIPKGV